MEEVQKILDADIDSDSDDDNQYLVQWKKGLRSQWVLEEDCNCPNAIFEYEKEQGWWDQPCEVEGIIEEIENSAGQTEYLVKWKDTEEWQNEFSWVKEEDFVQEELLQQFKTDENYNFNHQQPVVEQIIGVVRKPYDKYQVKFEDTPLSSELFSVDEIYVRPGGRKAIRQFYRRMQSKYPNDPYLTI